MSTPHGITFTPLTVVNDSSVARADPLTVTEWMPKTLVNQVATLRDALTVTESLAVRLVAFATVTLSLALPFFRYWPEAVLLAEACPAGI